MIVVEKPIQQMKSSYYNQYLPPCHLTLSSLDDLLHNRHSDLLWGWVHGELQQQHYGSKLYPTIKIDKRRAYLSEFKSWHCKDNTKFRTYIRSVIHSTSGTLGFMLSFRKFSSKSLSCTTSTSGNLFTFIICNPSDRFPQLKNQHTCTYVITWIHFY